MNDNIVKAALKDGVIPQVVPGFVQFVFLAVLGSGDYICVVAVGGFKFLGILHEIVLSHFLLLL